MFEVILFVKHKINFKTSITHFAFKSWQQKLSTASYLFDT